MNKLSEGEKRSLTPRAHENSNRKRRLVSVLLLILVLTVFSLIGYFVGLPLVRQFKESPETFQSYVSAHGLTGKLMMIGIVMMQVIIALIPGEPFELGAGFVFGWLEGAFLCLIAMALASSLIYLAVKKWGVSMIRLFFSEEKIDHFTSLLSEKKRDLLTFVLFLIPGTPKDLLVYVIGLTPMKLPRFLWISTLARIPSVISSTVTGSLVQSDKMLAAGITYGITLLISAGCVYWYRHLSKLEKQENAS